MADASTAPKVTGELLARYDRPGPRYTSYPTAPEFKDAFGPEEYQERLAVANRRSEDPLSLYVHIPFCEHRCHFCGCYVVITRREDVVRDYIEHLKKELSMVAAALPSRRRVLQLHWGGGTPTHLTPDQMREVFGAITDHFELLPNAEVALEADPRVTTLEQVDIMAELGFNRLSMGVQDFTPEVQSAIGREQTREQTRALCEHARKRGITDINIDLVYGLPLQTVESFRENLAEVIALAPGRTAVYSYAHVPWIRPNQRLIKEADLPDRDAKFALFAAAIEAFTAAGYLQIGMDHFARPEDELAQARLKGTLARNFMGYTVKAAPDMIGFGISAIGDVGGAYVQNAKKLSEYYPALDAGRLPVEKGCALSDDDMLRRYVIHSLMCNFELDVDVVKARFGVEFDHYFAEELADLDRTIDPGFYERRGEKMVVLPLGQLFVRNVVMPFDKYLKQTPQDKPLFSRTV